MKTLLSIIHEPKLRDCGSNSFTRLTFIVMVLLALRSSIHKIQHHCGTTGARVQCHVIVAGYSEVSHTQSSTPQNLETKAFNQLTSSKHSGHSCPFNNSTKFKARFKRRILHAPDRIAGLSAGKIRRLNQLNATYFNSMRVSRIFD